ncbi:MAG: OmpA family protein [Magnetococcales bacterium]|nr:OmpA family protein [Magnetococcales bacterium]NGZ28472.1 OmpA family protein [Magnetococcales bacterium]
MSYTCSPWLQEEEETTTPVGLVTLAMGVMGLSLMVLMAVVMQNRLLVAPSVQLSAVVGGEGAREVERLRLENFRLQRQLGLINTNVDTAAVQSEKLARLQNNLDESVAERKSLMERSLHFNQRLQNMMQARNMLLTEVKQRLSVEGIEVVINESTGRVQFPGVLVFNSGSTVLLEKKQETVARVADVLADLLACHAGGAPAISRPASCPELPVSLESILIEGHTDNIPVRYTRFQDNWVLSAGRASHVLNGLFKANPALAGLHNENGDPMLRVGGNGDRIPIDDNEQEVGRRNNRRVELRFTVSWPKLESLIEKSVTTQGE